MPGSGRFGRGNRVGNGKEGSVAYRVRDGVTTTELRLTSIQNAIDEQKLPGCGRPLTFQGDETSSNDLAQ